MAIETHRTSKNARYSDVLGYYTYRHREDKKTGHYEPILDEYGLMIERENYAVLYITAKGRRAPPERWAAACVRTNRKYGKNRNRWDRKSHEYILSHPAEDRRRMSTEDLLREGEAFAGRFFPGYDCLIAVHRDTDNDHIHITINSVRALPRPREEEWMMRGTDGQPLPCELEAGGKHQDSPTLRRAMNDWLLDYTRAHGLTAKDNNAIADANREKRHGGKNEQMREALLACARKCRSMPGLRRMLMEEYGMELTVRGQTVSVRHPGNQKFVRLKTLGLEPVDLFRILRRAEDRYDDEWANSEKEELRRELELTADLIRREAEAPSPPPQLSQEEKEQLWAACKAASAQFWVEYRERQGAIQRKLDEKYQLRRRLKEAEWALDSRNRHKSITGSVHAAGVLIKNDSRRWLEREIEELKEERRKLSERGEKFKARKEAAVALVRQGGNSMGQCMAAIEGLQDMAESLCWENTGMLHRPAPQKEQTAPKKGRGLDR